MPNKKFIIAGMVLLFVVLIIWANMADSPTQGVSFDGSTGTAAGLEKDLPTEVKIPTH